MSEFVQKKRTVVGLDIGRAAVKAVWAGISDGKPSVTRVETLKLPANAAENDSVIGPWLDKLGLSKRPCVLAISGSKIMFQPVLLQPSDPRSYEQAAAIEVLRFNEMASDTMTYGFSQVLFNPGERRFLLGMARQIVVDDAIAFARNRGLDVADLAPSPVAMFNAMECMTGPHDKPFLYVNIGAYSTEVAIGGKAGLMFARAFSLGSQGFTDAIARNGDLSAAQAENTKLADGSLLQKDQAMSAILRPVAEVWLSELKACLSVFQSLFPDRLAKPARAVIAGGGSLLKGFPEFITEKLGIETVRADTLPGNPHQPNAAAFLPAAGLAISVLSGDSIRISLLPESFRHELNFRRQRPFWHASAVAVALIITVSIAGGYYDFLRMKKHLQTQATSLANRQALVDDIEAARAKQDRVVEMAKPVKRLVRGSAVVRDILTTVAESKSPSDSISMICDAEFYFSGSRGGAPQPAPTRQRDPRRTVRTTAAEPKPESGFQRLLIEGYTRTPNFSTVKALIAKLRTLAFVASADLLNDDELMGGSRAEDQALGSRFVIDVRLVEP